MNRAWSRAEAQLAKLARYPAPLRILLFLIGLGCLWLPFLVMFHGLANLRWLIQDHNQATILSLIALYSGFIWLVRLWSKKVHQEAKPLWRFGLEFSLESGQELITGVAIGGISLLLLFVVQGGLGMLTWQAGNAQFWRIFWEGLLVALGFGFAEELLFRGWLLDELQRDYRRAIALWANAALFAAVHRWQQLPALTLLGATLVWAKWSRHQVVNGSIHYRLALPIGVHTGLVWGYYVVNVGQLIRYTGRAPTWMTGLDGNPLIGFMGLLFLSLMAISTGYYCQQKNNFKGN
jgi:hypothetical protein